MRGKAGTVSGRTLDELNRRIELRHKVEGAILTGLVKGDRLDLPPDKVYDRIITILAALEEAGLEIRNRKTYTKEG